MRMLHCYLLSAVCRLLSVVYFNMLEQYKRQLKDRGELYLRVKVLPGAAKTVVIKVMDDETIKVGIAAPPVKGKANQELVRFLAMEFDVLKNNVKIVSGIGERVKLIKLVK